MKDAKGHGSNGRGIAKVTAIRYSQEPGTSRRRVSVDHVDHKGRTGSTSGDEDNLHIGALVTRGLREGAAVSGGSPAYGNQNDARSQLVGHYTRQAAQLAITHGADHPAVGEALRTAARIEGTR